MIRYFAKHPTAANLLMASFFILGLFILNSIRRAAMPDFTTQSLQISASYPGATAEEIEEAVAVPLEDALGKVNNIKAITTNAMEGMVSINVEMTDGVDYQEFYNDVKTEIDSVSSLPNEVEKITLKPHNRLDQVVSLAVSGDISLNHLKTYCEKLKDKLMGIGGGIQVDISGFSQHEFRIELNPSALHTYKLSVRDIASIIKSQNVDLPAGTLETGKQDIKLRFSDRRKTLADLSSIRILSSSSGGEIVLGDIATITDCFESEDNKYLFNGQRAATLSVSKSKSADSLKIYDQVMVIIEEEKIRMPEIKFNITRNMASDIKDRLDMVYSNAIQGFILVFASLWLFLNLRLSIWVAMGLPVSFLGGLFFMHLCGISLNMISTFALIIALGLIMDDSIVISENIAVHLKKGESPIDAAVNGTNEVGRGVFSSFITTICVLGPLMFLSGQIGKILYVIPVTLIIVLAVSLVEAYFCLPNHLVHSFRNGMPEPNGCRKKIDQAIQFVSVNLVEGLCKRLIPYRYFFLTGILLLFIASLAMFPAGYLKFLVFPSVDGDTAVCKVMFPPGTPLKQSERYAEQLCKAAERMNQRLTPLQPGQKQMVEFISVQFSSNSDYKDSGPHLFTVYADLLSGNERKSTVKEVLNVWREESGILPGATSVKFEDMTVGPGGKALELRLHGDNLPSLKLSAAALREKLATYAGVYDITDNLIPGKPEVIMSLQPGAMKLGFTASNIAQQLRSAYQGEKADELQIGSDNYEFNVRMVYDLNENLYNFDNFQLTTTSGIKVPLLNVVTLRYARGLSSIYRYDGKRTVTVSADINNAVANSQEISNDLSQNYLSSLKQKYPGINYSFGGQRQASGETGNSMLNAFLIGVIGIFIILSLQFGKFLEPLIVMSNIPLAIIGVIWGHILLGRSFDMQGLIGVVSLAGVVVNDSILLMEFIKMREAEGIDPQEAACKASSDRFRSVMLTSLTTIAGLVPILLEKSLQAQMVIPLALSLVCGLATATMLVLFVVPSLYMIVQDWRNWLKA